MQQVHLCNVALSNICTLKKTIKNNRSLCVALCFDIVIYGCGCGRFISHLFDDGLDSILCKRNTLAFL